MATQNPEISSPVMVKPKKQRPRRWIWVLLGIFIMLLLAALGGGLGYFNGIDFRLKADQSRKAMVAVEQFQLGLQKETEGKLELARQHFEYVIQIDPSFPGAADELTKVMIDIAKTTAPTVAPTPTLSPTPDTRDIQSMYASAEQAIRTQNWDVAVDSLDALRKRDINYNIVQVDGMYYTALRNRGMVKITSGNLEGGMYDLTLAENFGPLDRDAVATRNWAQYYITGSSFWKLDWPQCLQYFSELNANMPNLTDNSGYSARERYRVALQLYGDQLFALEDACGARDQYALSLGVSNDGQLAPTATRAAYVCSPPTAVPPKATATTEGLPPEETPEAPVP